MWECYRPNSRTKVHLLGLCFYIKQVQTLIDLSFICLFTTSHTQYSLSVPKPVIGANMEWNQNFLVLRPSAATVLAIAWQKKAAGLLQERGIDPSNVSTVLGEAFTATVKESSSLPVRDKVYRDLTLHLAVTLMAAYHPYGKDIDNRLRPMGWSDGVWDRYLRLLKQHGLEFKFS